LTLSSVAITFPYLTAVLHTTGNAQALFDLHTSIHLWVNSEQCWICRREVTPPEVRAAREREKELAELDRDIRTVFAYNLNLKAEEKDLFQFFSTAGKVLDVRIISDRNTRRSKGFAYIEYARRVSCAVWPALTLSFHASHEARQRCQSVLTMPTCLGIKVLLCIVGTLGNHSRACQGVTV